MLGDGHHLTVPPSSRVGWGGMVHLSFSHWLSSQFSCWKVSILMEKVLVPEGMDTGRRNGHLSSLWLWDMSGQYRRRQVQQSMYVMYTAINESP